MAKVLTYLSWGNWVQQDFLTSVKTLFNKGTYVYIQWIQSWFGINGCEDCVLTWIFWRDNLNGARNGFCGGQGVLWRTSLSCIFWRYLSIGWSKALGNGIVSLMSLFWRSSCEKQVFEEGLKIQYPPTSVFEQYFDGKL